MSEQERSINQVIYIVFIAKVLMLLCRLFTHVMYIHVHVIPVCPFALSVSFDIFILRVTFNLCIMYCCLQNAVQDSNFPFLIFFY